MNKFAHVDEWACVCVSDAAKFDGTLSSRFGNSDNVVGSLGGD